MSGSEHSTKVWEAAFDEKVRQEQVDEDSAAWGAVTGLLLAIISFGVSLALFTAWFVTTS